MAYDPIPRYRKWYGHLLRLYPRPHRVRFGEGMEQIFNDVLRERREAGEGAFAFALWMFAETFAGIIRENLRYGHMKNLIAHPRAAAFTGFLFAVPFLVMNFIIALHIEPLYSFIGSFPAIRNATITPLILLLLFPIGAYIALRPMFQKDGSGRRRVFIANIIVALMLLGIFAVLFAALGGEWYRCDVLYVQNCD